MVVRNNNNVVNVVYVILLLIFLFTGKLFASYRESLVVWYPGYNPTYSYPVINLVTNNRLYVTNLVIRSIVTNVTVSYYRYSVNLNINNRVGWVVVKTNFYYIWVGVVYNRYVTNFGLVMVHPVNLVTNSVMATNFFMVYRGISSRVYDSVYGPVYGSNYICKDLVIERTNYFAIKTANGHTSSVYSAEAWVYVTTNMPSLIMERTNGGNYVIKYSIGGPDSELLCSTNNFRSWFVVGTNLYNYVVDTSLYPSAFFRLQRIEP